VNQVNAEKINGLIHDNRCIMVCELDKTVEINVSSDKTIIHNELNFGNVGAHWVPKLKSDEQKER
jgi:hypothetical protein